MFNEYKSIYMIGIGGISMAFIAEYLYKQGKYVFGSDVRCSAMTDKLKSYGIDVFFGHDQERVKRADLVVYTDAIGEGDKELSFARSRGIPCCSRVEMLNEIARDFSVKIAVCGSHGKTTTTSMLAHIIFAARNKLTAHIGGEDIVFGNSLMLGKELFLTEACEYKKNLSKLTDLDIAVCLNVDRDHLECYRDFNELKNAFYSFSAAAKICVVNKDEKNIPPPYNSVTYSLKDDRADYLAVDIEATDERYSFTVLEYGSKLCRVELNVYGRFQCYNALAAIATSRQLDISVADIQNGLFSFKGVKRRFERIGMVAEREFIADYAHHPTEIRSILALAHRCFGDRLFIIFQPHTYSRTKNLLEEFKDVFSDYGERLLLYKTYAAREEYDVLGSAEYLSAQIKNSRFTEDKGELKYFIQNELKKDVKCILFIGAGDIYEIAKELFIELKFNR